MAKFQTGDMSPSQAVIYRLLIPNTHWMLYNINLALSEIGLAHNWFQGGDVTPDVAAEMGNDVLLTFQPGGLMIGLVIPYIGAIEALPTQYLLCDGGTYESADYPALWAVIDDAWKISGTQFTVPDLAERTVIGASIAKPMGTEVGAAEHTLTIAEMPNHAHYYTPPVFNVDLETPGAPDVFAAGIGVPTLTDDEGGGGAHNNMQPSTALYYVVVAQ